MLEEIQSNDFPGVGENGFHGSSSNISFLRQVVDKETPKSGRDQPDREQYTPDLLGFTAAESQFITCEKDSGHLPDRQLTSNFVQCYFDFVHQVFPILHWPSFVATYDRFSPSEVLPTTREKRTREEVVFQATLNMVFALGCQRSEQMPLAQRRQFAHSCYNRSLHLVSVETLDFSSLQILQLILLRGIYLHYTVYAHRCWNTIGVALRVAQSLGLHFEESPSSRCRLEREMRRRVWHCCISLDRYSFLS